MTQSEEINFYWEKPISIDLIKDSWEAAFNKKFPSGYWDWRFNCNPYDSRVTAIYVLKDGVVAAYYAVSPLLIRLMDGKIYKAGLMNMGFTHPLYQGRGYYQIINNILHEQLKKEGYSLCYGFANHNSHYPYRKYLGWKDLSTLNLMSRKPDAFVSKLPVSNQDAFTFSINEINEFEIKEMSSLCLNNGLIHVERTEEYLRWRLLNNPLNKYFTLKLIQDQESVAILVYKKHIDDSIDIMDFFVSYKMKEEGNTILIETLDYLQNKEKCITNIWSNLYSDEHLALEKAGFRETVFSCYFGVINFIGKLEIENIESWHYRFIDSDIF